MPGDDNIIAALAYVFGWLSGLLAYFLRKESKLVRFHALQSIILSLVGGFCAVVFMVALWIVGIILAFATKGFGMLIIPAGLILLLLLTIALLVFLVYKAYNGAMYKLPVIGSIAEKYA
ncbi:MAG: hypothetical protein PHG85_04525 [Candidatus Altiarchaeota archaeon]|nr:hypothetical protein [Candidatus Altiarchaeota archaeon]